MKIAPPGHNSPPSVVKSRIPIPYYNARNAAEFWTMLEKWRAAGCPRLSFSPEATGDPENTLRSKLYNPLRWLKESGTPEQKALCETLSWTKIGFEFVLTIRRPKITTTLDQAIIRNEHTPHETGTPHDTGSLYRQLERDVIKFMEATVYDGKTSTRTVFEVTGVFMSDAHAAELTQLVKDYGGFIPLVRAGHRGSVRIIPCSEQEMKELKI